MSTTDLEARLRELSPSSTRSPSRAGPSARSRACTGTTTRTAPTRCVVCRTPLFDSGTKFESGTGWPSFYDVIENDRIATHEDRSLGMRRVELNCGTAARTSATSSTTARARPACATASTPRRSTSSPTEASWPQNQVEHHGGSAVRNSRSASRSAPGRCSVAPPARVASTSLVPPRLAAPSVSGLEREIGRRRRSARRSPRRRGPRGGSGPPPGPAGRRRRRSPRGRGSRRARTRRAPSEPRHVQRADPQELARPVRPRRPRVGEEPGQRLLRRAGSRP